MFVWKGRKNSEIQTPREETPPSFFSREKSCQLRPKATIEKKRKKKIGARSETVSGKTFATAIENTPRDKRARTKPYRSNSRSAFHFFSREVAAERRKNLRPTDERRITFTLYREKRGKKKLQNSPFFRAYLSSPQPQLVGSQSSWTFLYFTRGYKC